MKETACRARNALSPYSPALEQVSCPDELAARLGAAGPGIIVIAIMLCISAAREQ
jgi:hypothetical protein